MFRKGSTNAAARLLGTRGGKARAAILSPDRRRDIARKAAKARWATYLAARRARLLGRHSVPSSKDGASPGF